MSENLPAWDLSDLYKSIDDPQITVDLEAYRASAADFADRYKGKLAQLSADEFLDVIKDIEKRSLLAGRLGGFAYLNMVTQMKNAQAVGFYQQIEETLTDYAKPTVFFSVEFNALPQEKIDAWLKDERIYAYRY